MTKPLFRGLFLDVYAGSYGPTLRLETDAIEDLERLKTLFEAMTSRATVEILPSAGAVSESVRRLTLQNPRMDIP